MFNLLKEPLIRVRLLDGVVKYRSLPELLDDLTKDKVIEFPALRPHQKMAWHAFLIQLSALAMKKCNRTEMPDSATAWEQLVRSLTIDWPGDEPWSLVVPDIHQPAFLQAPVVESDLNEFNTELTPDGLDILVTSKNHDLKAARIAKAEPDDWIFALISVQTLGGYEGRTINPISRMNGGYGNRPFVSVLPPGRLGKKFVRDLEVAVRIREEIIENYPDFNTNGLSLIWLKAWDGENQIGIDQLDPFYIEICRRIRLLLEDSRILAKKTGSLKQRIICAEETNGNLGDLWAPVDKVKKVCLTIGQAGFNYTIVSEILFGTIQKRDFKPAPLQCIQPEDAEEGLHIHFFALARGQGKTEGLHERIIPITKKTRRLLSREEDKAQLARLAQKRIQEASQTRKDMLYPALFLLKENDEEMQVTIKQFDTYVDSFFFEDLWLEIEAEPERQEEVKIEWLIKLRSLALKLLRQAATNSPQNPLKHYRNLAKAELHFSKKANKIFPDTKQGNLSPAMTKKSQIHLSPIYELAKTITSPSFPKGSAAALRRMDHRYPSEPVFLKLLPTVGLDYSDDEVLRRYALIAKTLAMTAPIHQLYKKIGTALVEAKISELRFSKLLASRGAQFEALSIQLVQQLVSKRQPADWTEICKLILTEGRDEEYAEDLRLQIAKDFYSKINSQDIDKED